MPEAAERAKGLIKRLYDAADDIRMQTDRRVILQTVRLCVDLTTFLNK
ncbi:MAG TPA: hypothetical protein VED37_20080 [Ktedonobacteraceae bacterium]|nr:hypothetical protein [Ktedonobacteraceae bacterium]